MARHFTTLLLILLIVLFAAFIYKTFYLTNDSGQMNLESTIRESNREELAKNPDKSQTGSFYPTKDQEPPPSNNPSDQAETQQQDADTAKPKEKYKHIKAPGRNRIYLATERTNGRYWDETAEAKLEEVADYLKTNPQKIILITGYSEISGTRDQNFKESESRANLVTTHLVENTGVSKNQLRAIGRDKAPPIDEKVPIDSLPSRCVDIIIR